MTAINVTLVGPYDQTLAGSFHDFGGYDRKPINAHDTLNFGHQAVNETKIAVGPATNGRQRLMIGKLIGTEIKT